MSILDRLEKRLNEVSVEARLDRRIDTMAKKIKAEVGKGKIKVTKTSDKNGASISLKKGNKELHMQLHDKSFGIWLVIDGDKNNAEQVAGSIPNLAHLDYLKSQFVKIAKKEL